MGYQINQPFDWGLAHNKMELENSSGDFIDISARIQNYSVMLNKSYAIDNFSCTLDNSDNYISSNFPEGREIKIYGGFNQVEFEHLIIGQIADPETSFTKENGAAVTLSGMEWMAETQDRTVTEIYTTGSFTPATDPYFGEMVRDIIAKYCPNIDASLVPDTIYQLQYKIFDGMSAYGVIKWCADQIGYRFYLNKNKQLIFEAEPIQIIVSDAFTGTTGDPTGWTENSGIWALSANRYAQTNTSGTHTSYRTSENFTDGCADFTINMASGRAGMNLRLDTGTGNSYYIALDASENLVKLFRSTNWGASLEEIGIGEPNSAIIFGSTYLLRVFYRDDGNEVLFHVFMHDISYPSNEAAHKLHPVLSFRDDSAFTTDGKFGFTVEGGEAYFDSLTAANAYLIIEEAINAKSIRIKKQLSRQKNNIYVLGAYEKFPVVEEFTPSGSTDEIELTYLPSEVNVNVATVGDNLKGGIKGINDLDVTVYWLLDYYSKKLYCRGGDWPAELTTISYLKNIPVFANVQDVSSFGTGIRDYRLTDKTLNTQDLVEDRAQVLLNRLGEIPRVGSSTVVAGVWLMQPGNFVLVKSEHNNLPNFGIMTVQSIGINYSKEQGLTYDFTLDSEDISLSLLLNSIEERLAKLERRDIAQLLIKAEYPTDSRAMADILTGEENDISAALKLGYYAKLGYNRKLGNASTGWGAAF